MFCLIAAVSKNNVIGNCNKIPWNIPSERDRFKILTFQKKIIMGRKSFEEIGHALSYCTIIVVSKTLKKVPEGCLLAENLEKAIKMSGKDVIIAGGSEIYSQTIQKAEKLFLTEIDKEFSGDSFFPEFDKSKYEKTIEKTFLSPVKYSYVTYKKK